MIESLTTVGKGSALDHVIDELVSRGLLESAPARQTFRLHSLVQAAAYERFQDGAAFHKTVESRLPKGAGDTSHVEGLRPMVERFHHLCAAEHFEQARELYRDSLADALTGYFGEWTLASSLVSGLFSNGISSAPRLDKPSSNASTVRQLSEILFYQGSPDVSAEVARLAVERAGTWKTRQTVDIDLTLEAEGLLRSGQLARAEGAIAQAMENCQSCGEQLRGSLARELRARLGLIEDRLEDALADVDAALKIARSWKSVPEMVTCLSTRVDILLAAGQSSSALESAQEGVALAGTLAVGPTPPIAAVRAHRSLARALWAMATEGPTEEATDLLKQAQDQANLACRWLWSRNLVPFEADLRLVRAQVYEARGQVDRAYQEAERALRLARRCRAKLVEVDLHGLLAVLASKRGDTERSQKHAEWQRTLAWCDGAPHCYKSALQSASVG
jgi:tetratricopeptide (TPR) repeat protein